VRGMPRGRDGCRLRRGLTAGPPTTGEAPIRRLARPSDRAPGTPS
jgi:hypothetical protein